MTTLGRKKILVMDDSPLILEMVRGALEAAGYAVVVAMDLGELETQRVSNPPDLVLMDVQMPEAFGDDVAAVLREVRGVNAPIILLSSLSESELAERVREAGLDGYIPKQAGLEVLVQRVRSILGGESA